jgi:ribosomal protein L11 methyltransferase
MNNFIQISIPFAESWQCEMLIAFLSNYGFEGFEEDQNLLMAFIPEEKFDAREIDDVISSMLLSYSKKIIPQTNWNEEWEKSFDPVTVSHFCAVRACFHQQINNVQHEIIITPKMSFGTGHHPTTYRMIESMKDIDFTNKTVLDFGTGTGVLSILSEKLGAKKILAIDNDPFAVDNANENIIENGCSKIIVEQMDTLPHTENSFDIILANVNRNVILQQLPFFKQQLTSPGVLLLGGLLSEDFGEMLNCTRNYSLHLASKSLKNNWLCLKFFENIQQLAK